MTDLRLAWSGAVIDTLPDHQPSTNSAAKRVTVADSVARANRANAQHAYSESHFNPDSNTYAHSNGNADTDCYSHSYTNSDCDSYTNSDTKASWKAEADSDSEPYTHTYTEASSNSSATRLVVPGVAISCGVRWAPDVLLSFLAERIFALYPVERFFPTFQPAFKL